MRPVPLQREHAMDRQTFTCSALRNYIIEQMRIPQTASNGNTKIECDYPRENALDFVVAQVLSVLSEHLADDLIAVRHRFVERHCVISGLVLVHVSIPLTKTVGVS